MPKTHFQGITSDHVGIASSLLCLIHCISWPILTEVLALGFDFHAWQSDVIFLVVGLWAMVQSMRSTRLAGFAALFLVAYLLLFVGFFVSHVLESVSYLMHAASVSLIGLHFINYRQCRKCRIAT